MPSQQAKLPVATRYWPLIKLAILAVVLVFIAQRAIQLWKSTPPQSISVSVIWLIPAGIAYFAGWLPSVWLWMAFMRSMRQPLDWGTAVRAYYVGHLGKYVPGKALALVIRGTMIEGTGASPLLAGITGMCETIVSMATGAALFLAFSPFVFHETSAAGRFVPWSWCRAMPITFMVVVALCTFATTPFSAWFFTRLSRKITSQGVLSNESSPSIPATLVCKGVCATSVGWIFHALSLSFVVQSVSGDFLLISQFPLAIAAATFSMVGGFVVLIAPGGLGVREGLLIEVLKDQPHVGPAVAILVAGLWRATMFLTELGAAGILFITPRILRTSTPNSDVSSRIEH